MESEAVNYSETSIDFHHICEKTLIKVWNILFLQGESQRQECHAQWRQQMSEWEMEEAVPGTTEVEWGFGVFLPAHFLYRGVVRTVVHILGSGGGQKKKRQITDSSCGHFETVTLNSCGRCSTSWNSWKLGNCNYESYSPLTCLFSASAPMCPWRHDTILLCVLWDTTRTNSMRRSICARDKMCNIF